MTTIFFISVFIAFLFWIVSLVTNNKKMFQIVDSILTIIIFIEVILLLLRK